MDITTIMLSQLEHGSNYARIVAAYSLRFIQGSEVTPTLIRAFNNEPYHDVRAYIASTLGYRRDKQAIESLVAEFFSDGKMNARRWQLHIEIARALEQLGWKPSTPQESIRFFLALWIDENLVERWRKDYTS